jgi:cytochrome c-type biogenesis protein CcmE
MTVPVVYKGSVPDLMGAGRDVVVDGRMRNGVFVAVPDTLVTKCPSKYSPKR